MAQYVRSHMKSKTGCTAFIQSERQCMPSVSVISFYQKTRGESFVLYFIVSQCLRVKAVSSMDLGNSIGLGGTGRNPSGCDWRVACCCLALCYSSAPQVFALWWRCAVILVVVCSVGCRWHSLEICFSFFFTLKCFWVISCPPVFISSCFAKLEFQKHLCKVWMKPFELFFRKTANMTDVLIQGSINKKCIIFLAQQDIHSHKTWIHGLVFWCS